MDVLLNNAYRILGLPITATKREIVRRAEEMQTFVTIGETSHYETDLPWIGEFQRSEETVKKALQALEDPSTKLEHVLSWFWVMDEYDKLAMDALVNEDVDKAVEVWSAAAQQKGSHHEKNLATLEQILALRESDSEFDYRHLNKCINYWSDLSSSTQLLNLIENLDQELSKNITDTEVTKLISRQLTKIAIPFLMMWGDDGQSDKIGKFFEALNGSDLSPTIVSHITEEYIKPFSEKIERICSEFSDMDVNYEKIYERTMTFNEKVSPHFELIKQAGDNFLIEKIGDQVGSILLDKAIDYGNNTEQWKKSKELCELAKTFVAGDLLKDRLQRNLGIISKNVEQQKKWESYSAGQPSPPQARNYSGIGWAIFGLFLFICIISSVVSKKSKTSNRVGSRYSSIEYSNSERKTNKPPQRPSQFVYAKVRCNIRSGPGLDYSVVRKASKGEKLEYINRENKWFKLKGAGGKSQEWVHESVVTFIDVLRTQSGSVPQSSYLGRTPTSRTNGIPALREKIENSKQELHKMEAELLSLERNLNSSMNQLNGLKERLTDMERKMQLGLYVDDHTYKNNVHYYNDLVNIHNACLAKYKAKYKQYNSLFDATAEDIRQYNRLVKVNR